MFYISDFVISNQLYFEIIELCFQESGQALGLLPIMCYHHPVGIRPQEKARRGGGLIFVNCGNIVQWNRLFFELTDQFQ